MSYRDLITIFELAESKGGESSDEPLFLLDYFMCLTMSVVLLPFFQQCRVFFQVLFSFR